MKGPTLGNPSRRKDILQPCRIFYSLAPTLCITLQALITAMRHWQVIPTALLFDNGSHFRGTMLRVFCQRLDIELI